MDDFGVTLVPDATILVEVAVFLIVLTVVSRYVLPRIRSAVAERQRHVSEQLTAAEKAEVRARQAEQQAAAALGAARREARRIIEDAYERRDHLIKEGIRKGREEYEWYTRHRPSSASPLADGASTMSASSA
jgi:F-type H+-transporting ATPase subunit b